jgi:hypothetical protein
MKNVSSGIKKPSWYFTGNISPQQCPVGYCYVRVDVSTAATMNNSVSWDVAPCESCRN